MNRSSPPSPREPAAALRANGMQMPSLARAWLFSVVWRGRSRAHSRLGPVG